MASYIGFDIVSIVGMHTVLTFAGVVVPADFALAFAISRLLRRVRLPIDLTVAGILARAYPPLAMVQPSKAFAALAGKAREESALSSSSSTTPSPSFLRRAGQAFAALLDKYGLAFLVAQRMFVGLTSVFSIFFALRMGLDVQGWLSSQGLALGGLGSVAGTWAAAACCAAFGFPGVLLGAGHVGRALGRLRKARFGSSK